MGRKIGLWSIAILLVVLMIAGSGTVAQAEGINPYDITSYEVNIRVDKKNVYHIDEKIGVYFNRQRHGIYRDIPVINKVTREDGSSSKIQAAIDHIDCHGDTNTVKRSGSNCRIKLGDEDRTLLGAKAYHISYEYHMGHDVLKDADEIYYNVIGTGWDTTIQNVNFQIEMPEVIDEGNVGMAYGSAGSTNDAGLTYTVDGNVLKGTLDQSITLQPGEAVTVRMTMPEGYFEKQLNIPLPAVAAILVSIAGMLAAFLMWWKVGRDNPVVETIQFHAPKGFNSLEVALMYRGKVRNKDVVSLIVYLAQKGYIRIYTRGKSRITGEDNFTLEKVREYDGNNKIERGFMDKLFAQSNLVGKGQLRNTFYKTVEKVVSTMNSKQNRQVIFYNNSINKHVLCVFLAVVVFLMVSYQPMYEYTYSVFAAIVIPVVLGSVFFSLLIAASKQSGMSSLIASLVSCLFMSVYMALEYVNAFRYAHFLYKVSLVIGIVACLVIAFFDHFMPKRTPYGTEMLGKILGFKRFLETAEKDRLEMLVEKEPEYFYNILPYAYVLDVSDAWMEKFESIAMQPPGWYGEPGGRTFRMHECRHFMHHTMRDVGMAMNSRPSSSGSGHSGGGHSGGGSGGGGGGSW